MAAPSDMFVTVMRHSGLSNNEIENAIFQIAQKHSTDDHDIIADTFLEAHRCGIAAGADEGDVEGFRIEIKNFLHGCTDLEDQRAVRSRKSATTPATATVNDVAPTAATSSTTSTTTPTTTDRDMDVAVVGEKGKERTREKEEHEEGGGSSAKKAKASRSNGGKGAKSACVEGVRDEGGGGGGAGGDVDENSSGLNVGNRMMIASVDDEDAVANSAGLVALVEDGGVVDEEIVDKEEAYVKLSEMRVTLEQDGNSNSVNKNPPHTARQVLSGLRVNKQMMTHCITGETQNSKVIQSCVIDQKCITTVLCPRWTRKAQHHRKFWM